MDEDRSPGWDMRAIAEARFGSLKPMFQTFGWEWSGAGWLAVADSRILAEYDSIKESCSRWRQSSDDSNGDRA